MTLQQKLAAIQQHNEEARQKHKEMGEITNQLANTVLELSSRLANFEQHAQAQQLAHQELVNQSVAQNTRLERLSSQMHQMLQCMHTLVSAQNPTAAEQLDAPV